MNPDDEIQEVRCVEVAVRERIAKSITCASCNGRTVADPKEAAEYAANGLLWHETALLAEAAITFARSDVVRLLAAEVEP